MKMKTAPAAFVPLESLKAAPDRKACPDRNRYWRTLDELSGQVDEQPGEFPENAESFTDETSRRKFLHLAGASLALAPCLGMAFVTIHWAYGVGFMAGVFKVAARRWRGPGHATQWIAISR